MPSGAEKTRRAAPRIAVALCTWRGRAHLSAQLDSIARQSLACRLFVHDDASNDGTAELARAHPAVEEVIAHAENVGHVRNFERALGHALSRDVDYIAFSDQDDLWRTDRLEKGLAAMRRLERRDGIATPLLVHSDLEMIDATGRTVSPSFLGWRRYEVDGERNLPRMLGRCGVMGNTCLLNRALGELALPFPPGLHVHDWWVGVLAEIHGARAFVAEPLVRYRIHADNASNSLATLDGGAGRATPGRILRRDFRLPFLEDTRLGAVESLLAGDGRRGVPRGEARRRVEEFRAYLALEGTRLQRTRWLLRGDWLARSWRSRARIACALLLSTRYARDQLAFLNGNTTPGSSTSEHR